MHLREWHTAYMMRVYHWDIALYGTMEIPTIIQRV